MLWLSSATGQGGLHTSNLQCRERAIQRIKICCTRQARTTSVNSGCIFVTAVELINHFVPISYWTTFIIRYNFIIRYSPSWNLWQWFWDALLIMQELDYGFLIGMHIYKYNICKYIHNIKVNRPVYSLQILRVLLQSFFPGIWILLKK